MIQVISLSCSFTYSGKYGIAAVLGCDISDQLLDQDCLTYTSTAKKSDLSTLLVRTEKVNNFNTSFQQLLLCGLLYKFGSRSVNRLIAYSFGSRLIINGITKYVKDTPQCVLTYRYTDGSAGCYCIHASLQSVGGTHRDTSDSIISQMLRYLHGQRTAVLQRNSNSFVNLGKSARKLQIQYGADNLRDLS